MDRPLLIRLPRWRGRSGVGGAWEERGFAHRADGGRLRGEGLTTGGVHGLVEGVREDSAGETDHEDLRDGTIPVPCVLLAVLH